MTRNVGTTDRIIRLILGLVLLSAFFVLPGGWKFIGLIALLPLATAALGTCPLYSLLGISTRRPKRGAQPGSA